MSTSNPYDMIQRHVRSDETHTASCPTSTLSLARKASIWNVLTRDLPGTAYAW